MDRRLSLFGGLVGGTEVSVSDGTAVGPGSTDVLVRRPLGFTALTEAHGDEQAADLVGGFCVAVRQLLADHQAQEVKTIGDALMLRSGDAAAAIRLEFCIVHDDLAASVRVGNAEPQVHSHGGRPL
jgi:hypothetical protein